MAEAGVPPQASAHLDVDALTDLVTGSAAPDARARALDHARDCPACEARLREAVGDFESLRARAGSALGSAGQAVAERRPPARLRPVVVLRWAAPLAVAAALVAVFFARPRPASRPAAADYWIPAAGDVRVLRDVHGTEPDSAFWLGLQAYEAHDAARAETLLRAAHATSGLEDMRQLYLASSLLNGANAGEALHLLQGISPETLPMPWRQDARWMTYEALVQLRRGAAADSLLGVMAAWPGPVGDRARTERARRLAH